MIHFFVKVNCSWDKQQFLATEEEHFTQEERSLDVRLSSALFSWLSQFDYTTSTFEARKIGLKPNWRHHIQSRKESNTTEKFTFYSFLKRCRSNSVFCMHDWFQKSTVVLRDFGKSQNKNFMFYLKYVGIFQAFFDLFCPLRIFLDLWNGLYIVICEMK